MSSSTAELPEAMRLSVDRFRDVASGIEAEVARVMVGQTELVRFTLITLLSGGHALLEGVPGIGKTLLMRTLADVIDGSFSRIQFTPDLMPADIVGTMVLYQDPEGRREFRFEPGPIFGNFVLADEINRATPKTQSAMLEAMAEQTVTVGKKTYSLPKPFFVLGTQNPLEMEGTFPLPEAQLDRFAFKLDVEFPSHEELVEIAVRTTGETIPRPRRIAGMDTLLEMTRLVRAVPVAQEVLDYAARLVRATHLTDPSAPGQVREFVRFGASPRGLQAMALGAKVHALLTGRHHVSRADIRAVAIPALRHRVILNFAAQAEGISPDRILGAVIREVAD
jgi:MoxR-like ATPase